MAAIAQLVLVAIAMLTGVHVATGVDQTEPAPVNARHCEDTFGNSVPDHGCSTIYLSAPADGASVSATPTLTVSMPDWSWGSWASNPDVATINVCSDAACSAVVRNYNTPQVMPPSAPSWVVSPALANGTYYWRAIRSNLTTPPTTWTPIQSFVVGPVNTAPSAPATLTQFRSDGTTAIASGAWTNQSTVVLKFNMSDTNASQTLTPWVEVRTNTSWAGTCGTAGANMYAGAGVAAPTGGTPVLGTVTVAGLSSSSTYYWRACVVDQGGLTSGWTARGAAPDFRVDTVAPGAPATRNDGAAADVATQTGATVAANWSAVTDAAPGATQDYDWCINETADCTTTPVSTGTTASTSFSTSSAPLTSGASYYSCIRTRDTANNTSAYACTNGFQFLATVTVTSTSPNTVTQGRKGVVVQVNGTNFQSGATVAVSGAGVTVTNTAFVSATRVDVTLDVTGSAATTARNVVVTNTDASNGTGSNVLTVVAPSLSIALSVLDHDDAVRDASAPFDFSFGGGQFPGAVREVGTPGSGQRTPGAAFQVTRTSDTDTILQVSLTNFTSGGNTVPAGAMSWRVNGAGGAWTPFTTGGATIDPTAAPGVVLRSYDVRIDVPVAQAAGSYTSTMTWTTVATP